MINSSEEFEEDYYKESELLEIPTFSRKKSSPLKKLV
jgi:hypothetical protein